MANPNWSQSQNGKSNIFGQKKRYQVLSLRLEKPKKSKSSRFVSHSGNAAKFQVLLRCKSYVSSCRAENVHFKCKMTGSFNGSAERLSWSSFSVVCRRWSSYSSRAVCILWFGGRTDLSLCTQQECLFLGDGIVPLVLVTLFHE